MFKEGNYRKFPKVSSICFLWIKICNFILSRRQILLYLYASPVNMQKYKQVITMNELTLKSLHKIYDTVIDSFKKQICCYVRP